MRIPAKIRTRLMTLLSSGLTPHKLALTVALGVSLGILPLLWGTTLLCAGVAFLFGLNQGGIQIVNYLAYPLQLALLVPFYRLGARLFPAATVAGDGGTVHSLAQLGGATIRAVAAWLVVAPEFALLLYVALLPLFKRREQRSGRAEPKTPCGGYPSPSP